MGKFSETLIHAVGLEDEIEEAKDSEDWNEAARLKLKQSKLVGQLSGSERAEFFARTEG